MKRSEFLARWLGAGLGVVGGFLLGYFLVRGVGNPHPGYVIIGLTTLEGLIFAYLGTPYVLGGWRTFNFRLTSTPLPDLLSGLLGMVVGLVIAVRILEEEHVRRPRDPVALMAGDRHRLKGGVGAEHLAEEVLVDSPSCLGDQHRHSRLARH